MSLIEPVDRVPLEGDEAVEGIPGTHVHDFWRFALPNLQVNTARGWFAEFLVAKAVGIERPVRIEWDDYDVVWEGIRIEVKASGRMQTWVQKKPSQLRFSGLSSRSWTAQSVDYAAERSYNADLYVFAVQTSDTHENYDPLDVNQWRFAVLPVAEVEATGYRSLSWAAVERLAGGDIGFAELRDDIVRKSGRTVHDAFST